ncbi:hypothetical protein GCM10023093_10000 [Nemorincola caseinilytica]|uniref:Uncharacterized protein n=1 Tax=Nemorincola caseinilytica TaxID=2054315 RepID=A0ABP8N7S8_9BACT
MKNTISLLLLCAAALGSCKKNDLPAQSFQYTNGYNLTMSESWDGKLRLLIKSNTDLNCLNYGVGHTLTIGSNTVDLKVSGVSAPATCSSGNGPATDTPSLGILGVKTYNLTISCDGSDKAGTLTVSNSKYTISYPGGNNITFTNSDLNRIPDKTLWGTIDYASGYAAVADTFLDSLEYYGAADFTGPLVSYTSLTAYAGNTFTHEKDPSMPRPYKNFIYTFSGVTSDITTLVNRFKRYGDNVKIALTTDHQFFGTGTGW